MSKVFAFSTRARQRGSQCCAARRISGNGCSGNEGRKENLMNKVGNVNLSETAPTRFQDIGGVSLAYRHFGKEGAPPVVCLQHFTGTMNNFDPIHTNRSRWRLTRPNWCAGSSSRAPDRRLAKA